MQVDQALEGLPTSRAPVAPRRSRAVPAARASVAGCCGRRRRRPGTRAGVPRPRNSTYSAVQRPTPRKARNRATAAASSSCSSSSRSRRCSARARASSMIARAFCRLKPSARSSSGSRPARSSGEGNANARPPGPSRPGAQASARRLSSWMPRLSVTCWQANALTSVSKRVGKRGGFRPQKSLRQGAEDGVAGGRAVEVGQTAIEAEQAGERRHHARIWRTGAGSSRSP